MLLLFGTARRHATSAIRLGHDPVAAARNVVLGNPALDLTGLAPPVAKLLAVAHADGIQRAAKIAGAKVPDVPAPDYAAAAQKVAQGMADTLGTKIEGAVKDARAAGLGVKKTAAAARQAVKDAGYGPDNTFLLETVAARQIIEAHGVGMWAGWKEPGAAAKLKGFVHLSVIDAGTTRICMVRDGLKRPKDDPYWTTNQVPLHWGCRSVILPLFHDADWTPTLPTTPPAPGFGWAMSPLRSTAA